jgi:thiamine-monophosphate kinase
MSASIEEFDIIERYFAGKISRSHENILLGPGDDCGMFTLPADQSICISTDTLVAGTHFPTDCAADIVAHRSMVANLSDLAAMGAKPFAYTLALTLDSKSATHCWLEAFSSTLQALGDHYEISLIGGNLAKGNLSLTYTVLGTVDNGRGIKRDGAQVGDGIYVTGTLGNAAGGLKIVQSSNTEDFSDLVTSYNYPTPRIELGLALQPIASSAIDISDGFASDLTHICERSVVGAQVELDCLPLSASLVSYVGAERAHVLGLSGGDDYELCFTAAQDQADALKELSRQLEVPIHRVGTIVEMVAGKPRVSFHEATGAEVKINHLGYRHFE